MLNKELDKIEIERETSKLGLDSFVHYLEENSFSEAVFEQTEKLQNELNEAITEFLKNQEKLDQSAYNYQLDIKFLEDKLSAISEMNIIYAFKDFEINLKKLLGATYKINAHKFYKWESTLGFLKSKKITPSEIRGYQEINDLRKLNNFIKHSTSKKVDDRIKSIPEFKELKFLRHYELTDFFNRVKDFPYVFLYDLSSKIYKDLYEFDSNRLKSIAKLFALRMDKKTAELFIEELKKLY